VGDAISIDISGGHVDTAREGGSIGVKTGQKSAIGNLPVGLDLGKLAAVYDFYVRSATGACTGDYVQVVVGIDLADRHVDASHKGGIVGVKAPEKGAVGNLAVGLGLIELGAIDHFHQRRPPGPGSYNHVAHAIAIDIADSHAHPAL